MPQPVLFMLMGLPCSGKTTLARKIAKSQNALFLDADAWMEKIVGDGFDFKRRVAVHDVQFEVAHRVLELGRSVVMDFGFFFRTDRDTGRKIAAATGASVRLVFLDAPINELQKRIDERNQNLPPNTFHITREHLELCQSWLERPEDDEPLTSEDEV